MDDENTVYEEADSLKAEEFKDKGNEYFKGKCLKLYLKYLGSQFV